MYRIKFYADEQGNQPVRDYLKKLNNKTDKDSRIKINKIHEYIETLKTYGTRAGLPFVKHMGGDIWELRPLADRFFFFYWSDNCFVFLHHYHKKTNKTPLQELDQAKRNLKSFLERNGSNEH